MQDQEVKRWQRALHLYRQRLEETEEDPPSPDQSPHEVASVKAKLDQLLSASLVGDSDPLQKPLDYWVLKLGLSSSDAENSADEDDAASGMLGRQLGDWTIKSNLGRGGMASVFLVERSDVEFKQRAALKLLSLLMLATGGSKRFIREQQFLAQLQHPNIAMLLDGGVADDGTPFLVTELVEGLNIAKYCEQRSLGKNEILALVLQVCEAVSHAHSKLILHRDIKPSNVLVTDKGQVKLLDFGIGKLDDGTSDSTLSRVYTPKYAAPEQRHGDLVTTATDVHGLGTLTLTLLNGCSDHDQSGRSELASVLAKATHEDPGRRYNSAESLARDLRYCLENRPTSAVPDSTGYRIRKFVRRNRAMVAAGSAIFLIALVGVLGVLWQAEAARSEAQKARTLSNFMIELFADGDLFSGQGPDTPISTVMQSAAQRARTQLISAPEARSEVLRVVGLAQTEFGEYQLAGENLTAALGGVDDPLMRAKVLGSLGVWSAEQADFSEGISQMREALEIMAQQLPASHPDRLEVETDLINFLLFTGEAQASLDRADALIADIGSVDKLPDLDQANILRSRGMALTQLGQFDEAISHMADALVLAKSLSPPRPALIAAFQNDLGIAFAYKGDKIESVEAFNDSYQTQTDIYGPEHKRTITSGTNLVIMMRSAGQYQRAIDLGEKLLRQSLETFGEISRSTVLSRFALALVLSDAGRNAQANQQLQASVSDLRQLPEMRYELPNHLSWQGETLIREAKFEGAIALLEEAEAIRDAEFPEEPRRYRVAAQQRLVQAHAALNQCETATQLLSGIKTELLDGDADQWMATSLYLLNCEANQQAAAVTYAKILDSLKSRSNMDSSLKAALLWSETRFR